MQAPTLAQAPDLRSFSQAEIDNWFTYHTPTAAQQVAYREIRTAARIYAETVNKHVPAGADKTAAMRTIRKSVMDANLAVACHIPENQPAGCQALPGLVPNLLEQAARAAHEANRILCLALGDNSQPSWDDAPQWQKDSALAGVRMIVANPSTTPEESHQGWLAQKRADGWKYGPMKNPETKEHPCFIPYDGLPESQRAKDHMFGLVVRSVLGI